MAAHKVRQKVDIIRKVLARKLLADAPRRREQIGKERATPRARPRSIPQTASHLRRQRSERPLRTERLLRNGRVQMEHAHESLDHDLGEGRLDTFFLVQQNHREILARELLDDRVDRSLVEAAVSERILEPHTHREVRREQR